MKHFNESMIDTESIIGVCITVFGLCLFLSTGEFIILLVGLSMMLFSIMMLLFEISINGDV
jgi:hypothetical protein